MNSCEWCSTPFAPRPLRSDGRRYSRTEAQRFCSMQCNQASYHARNYVKQKFASTSCAWCFNEFTPRTATQKWCSRKCGEKGSYRDRVGFPEPWPCNWCGTVFDPMTSRSVRPARMRFCSKFCRGKAATLTCYNVTGERLFEMLAAQGGQCATGCGSTISLMVSRGDPQATHIDHDHKCCPGGARSCGRCIRGLLCVPCNQTLGWLETETGQTVDPVDRCFGLAVYLLRSTDVLALT